MFIVEKIVARDVQGLAADGNPLANLLSLPAFAARMQADKAR